MKQSNIRSEERFAAEAAYNKAREVYDKIIQATRKWTIIKSRIFSDWDNYGGSCTTPFEKGIVSFCKPLGLRLFFIFKQKVAPKFL